MLWKIIALAVAGLMSGAAFAQTNVTVYGAADVTFDNVKSTGATTASQNMPSRNRVSGNSSLLGFKGTEDLGGGLKAVFQFEGGVANDAAGAFNFNRDTFVGLSGGFGTVAAGILTGPTRGLGAAMDPFVGATGITSNTGLIGKMGGAGTSIFDTRWDNAVAYISPSMSGLTVTAAYVANENKSRDGATAAFAPAAGAATCVSVGQNPLNVVCSIPNSNAAQLNTRGYDIGARYANGPILAGLTYNKVSVGDTTGIEGSDLRAAFRYDFGMGTVGLMLDRVKWSDNVGSEKRNAWFIPVTFNVTGNGKIVAQYGKAGDISGTSNTGAKQFAVGYEHSLSKRTTLKAVWSQISNEADANYDFGLNPVNAASASNVFGGRLGADPKGFQVGVRHSF